MQGLISLGRVLIQELTVLIITWKKTNDIKCLIHPSTIFPHPFNIVIHQDAKIGKDCVINQGVTIGNRKGVKAGVPTIGNNVHIFANAVILGNVHIGDNSIIRTCSLVLEDVPPNSIVYGIPAKVVRRVENENLYTKRKSSISM